MKKIKLLLLLQLFVLTVNYSFSQANDIYNIKDFGAVGDGVTLDSKAINKAIETAASKGGGDVIFPAGNFLSGVIHLKSNIHLILQQGSVLIATGENPDENYDAAEQSVNTTYQDYGHSHFHDAFIWGDSIHDVSITGPGMIWGKGLIRDWIKNDRHANKAICLYRCRNVIIRDVSILHGGWFAILATGVDNLTIDNLKIDTDRDGMDIDCCKGVRVINCFVNSPLDDGICLKSTFALGYFKPTENVTITNCQVSGYVEGSLLDGTFKHSDNADEKPTGRIKFGTESNGGFKNITISNCVFDYCRGLALETVDGGLLEDVTIDNITMRDIVNDPIFLRLGARMRAPQNTPVGKLHRVIISNVIVYNADSDYACTISGIPGNNIEDVELDNISIYYKGGVTNFNNDSIPEKEKGYPEPGMFGAATSSGFFIRHVSGLKLNNINIKHLATDKRPAFILNDVSNIDMREISIDTKARQPWAVLKNVNDFHVSDSKDLKDMLISIATEKTLYK
ncbi:MAG TPA: glycoside hydrolase family 28 protein [Parafilimonas sp.]|nr:glycoside hydrolase family 28 protein [Parafilimonas sp.]